MPTASLNNVATQAAYVDALTVQFPYARGSFAIQVSNAAVFYQLAYTGPSGRDVVWMPDEHYTVQALLTFNSPTSEGLPEGVSFGGVRLRSALSTKPARVSVM